MQASNLDQLGSGLLSVLQNGLQQAADQADQQPERFSQLLSQAVEQAAGAAEEVAQIPQELWNKLKESADHPDWLGLLLFLAAQLRDVVGDPPLKIGAYDPGDGWSRALILIYTPPVNGAEFRLSLAIGGEGTKGIIIETKNAPSFELPANPLVFSAQATGDGKWRFPLNANGSGPTANATLGLAVALAQPILPGGGDGIALRIGVPKVSSSAEVGIDHALKWQVDVSLGTEAAPGVQAKVDLASFFGDLATILHIQTVDERYSPTLHFSSQQAPIFDIGHSSL